MNKDMKVDSNFVSQCFGFQPGAPVDLHKNKVNDVVTKLSGDGNHSIEANLWLPFASHCYNISPNLSDYVLVPIPALISDVPNTNGDSVTLNEFLKFQPEYGMQAFKTFRGKPTFLEHANKNIVEAKGVILDVFLRPLQRYGNGKYYKMVELLAFDRTKDPMLVNSILTGDNNSYSVGFYFKSYTCSICGTTVGQGHGKFCEHTVPRRPTYKSESSSQLVYRQCRDIVGFETSVVNSPAYVCAIGPHILNAD